MKFTAKPIDLDLELTLQSKEEVFIAGPTVVNSEQAVKLLKLISKDDELMMKEGPEKSIDITCSFLKDIYGKDKPFWVDNFPPSLLFEIRKWFVRELAGIKKKD